MSMVAIPGVFAASRRRSLAYSAEVLADSPLLYLRLEETSGSTCANAGSMGSSCTANGTFTRNVASHAGLGVCIDLAGSSSDYISHPDNASLDLTGNFTYELWAKLDVAVGSNYYTLMGKNKGPTTSDAGYTFYINPSRQLVLDKMAVANLLTSTGTISDDQAWYHLAVTRSSNTYTFYINGSSAGTGSNSTTINANARIFSIGAMDNNGSFVNPFNGKIDEPAVYNTALSAARILAHYNAAV